MTAHASPDSARRGVACAGNWIVDHVKIVDVWPSPGYLSIIFDEERGTGGAPFNVLVDLAKMEPNLPVDAIGLVGGDADGGWIREMIRPLARDMSGLIAAPGEHTSYTDVMTVKDTGQRTFFHLKGANAKFDVQHVNITAVAGRARIFHLGYLFLMDTLDSPDAEFGTRAARLLAECRKAGLITSIDMVSSEGSRYAEVVIPALRHTDYCIVNELEAQAVTGLRARGEDQKPDWTAIEAAARGMARLGVHRVVTIHLPEGTVSLDIASGQLFRVPSLKLPPGFIKGTAGAGDAFCAGMLLGLHEGWPLERCMKTGHAAAAASLRHATCTQGMTSLAEVMSLAGSLG